MIGLRGLNRTAPLAERIRNNPRGILLAFLVSGGMLLFAVFIHRPLSEKWIAWMGLAASSVTMVMYTRSKSISEVFGLSGWNWKVFLLSIAAVITGMLLGMLTRNHFELPLFPSALTMSAFISPLTGIAEEFVFRGYIQGILEPVGRFFPILFAAAMHTCYKLLVILTLSSPLQFNLIFLVSWTFAGGLLFGLFRRMAGNTTPAFLSHASFNILLYGGMDLLPLWVWS